MEQLPAPCYDLLIKKGVFFWLLIGFAISSFLAAWGFNKNR
ncbi:MAG: hypothetical protein N4A54_04090 [Peptostreptococcaceae bacterium]|jgi:hypothetical protein|nr:hypothetical protein [Peptostreptococcaceae bacterium]